MIRRYGVAPEPRRSSNFVIAYTETDCERQGSDTGFDKEREEEYR